MSLDLPTTLSVGIAVTTVVLCYVYLYGDYVLVVHRALFFRIGLGALVAAVIGVSALVSARVSIHLLHAAFAVSIAAAIRSVRRGIHPRNESWFYTLFER